MPRGKIADRLLVQSWSSVTGPSSVELGAKSALCCFFLERDHQTAVARQVDRIRHWKIIEGTWEDASDIDAHWHIDPPYQNPAGRVYRYNGVNRRELAKWCKRRRGFVQVCENDGAKWLRFEPLSIVHTHRARGYTAEAVYEVEN